MEHKFDKLDRGLVRKDSTVPPGSSISIAAAIVQVAVAWRGIPPSVDGVVGCFTDTALALRLSNDGSTHITQISMGTGKISPDGQIWLCDGADNFSAFPTRAAAREHQAISGGRIKSFVLNVGNKGAPAGDMQKAALAAIKDSLGKPLSAARAMWR